MCHDRLWADFQPLLLILDTLQICDCLTQRLWHFNHNFQLNDLTHCGDIFFLREKPLVICDVWNICTFFHKREIVYILQPFHFTNFFRVNVNEQLISALRSFVHVGFFGLSPNSVHLLHPFQTLWFCTS